MVSKSGFHVWHDAKPKLSESIHGSLDDAKQLYISWHDVSKIIIRHANSHIMGLFWNL
jgi:hypothetical protein